MTLAGWITVIIIGLAGLFLISGWLRPDLIALFVIVALGLTGVLTPDQALSGFSQSPVITILSVFILSAALEETGVTRWIGNRLLSQTGEAERRVTAMLTLVAAGLSLVMNNVAAIAVLLPTAMGVSRQAQIPPSRLLIPLAFGSLLGGMATILTSANIIVSSHLEQSGFVPFGLFDFLPIGIGLVLLGTALITFMAPRRLPSLDLGASIARMHTLQQDLSQVYHLQEATSEIIVLPSSPLAGQTLGQAAWGANLGLTVLGILRGERMERAPTRETRIQGGDILFLEGNLLPDQLQEHGLALNLKSKMGALLQSPDFPLVEALLAPRSELEGQTLREMRFRERHGLQVLAIWREGEIIQAGVADVSLRFGDALLLQGSKDRVELLSLDANFILLQATSGTGSPARALLAIAILVGSLGLAAFNLLPIALATLAGAALMVASGCIRMDQAYRSVQWKSIFFIAGMLPLSLALESSGTAELLGRGLMALSAGMGSLSTAAVLILAAIAMNSLLGAQTTAIVLAPVAVASATSLGADPRSMAMAVALGSSMAFISPLGHPGSMLVMAPGGYTFRDFARLGLPLTLLLIPLVLAGLRIFWGL